MTTTFLTRRRIRQLREYLTAYFMIAPSVILIFTFGIFPVGFALYVSLHKWRIKKGAFKGIENYTKAVDNLTYIIMFLIAIGAILGAIVLIRKIRDAAEKENHNPWFMLLPGLLYAATIAAFVRWSVLLLPEVLAIADKIIGVEKTRDLFMRLLGEAFRADIPHEGWKLFRILFLVSVLGTIAGVQYLRKNENLNYLLRFTVIWIFSAIGVFVGVLLYRYVAAAYTLSLETGEDPGIIPQALAIFAGVGLLIAAWKIWGSAKDRVSDSAFWFQILAALVFLVGGALLITEIPTLIAAGDKDLWQGLKVTAFYSLGTVPFQLAFSLFLAILLFQKLRGSEMFRMLYFLPYVTPTVASAAIFRQLFSSRYQAPINQLLLAVGLEPQTWLREARGVFSMIFESIGIAIPEWAAGPSLALVVIMIYSIWTFVGYDTVIYLAGLGNISTELMEASEIDGANKWQAFRYITFPLLSPTTYFLSLIAIIGTFKAFNHIWVMREGSALGTTDTFSVVVFSEFFEKTRYGYASTLAFVLFAVILSLTFINNKVQGSRVFYG